MRLQTTDPLGFTDSLNLYTYMHNNTFHYCDPDGRFVMILAPLITGAFGAGGITISVATAEAIIGTVVGFTLGWGAYETVKWADHKFDQVETDGNAKPETVFEAEKKGRKRGKDNEIKDDPPRAPGTANYLPDPAAEGSTHTTLGIKQGRKERYVQGATLKMTNLKVELMLQTTEEAIMKILIFIPQQVQIVLIVQDNLLNNIFGAIKWKMR